MKKGKRSENGRKTGRILCMAAVIPLLIFLLAGCGGERMETRKEIDRIYREAERTAKERAAAYIAEKYGIEAYAEGYWVQGYHDFFAPYVSSKVVVFMEQEGRKFCVGLDVDDETILWDNYQREEIEAVLQNYFMELYGLSPSFTAKTEFRLENAPDFRTATPAEWREKGYGHGNMVDFYFQGQTAEEMLPRINYLEFTDSWLSSEQSLEAISFEAGDWPVCEGGYVKWNLHLYHSPEGVYVDSSVEYPDIAGFPYFREWRQVCLSDRGTEEEELSGTFWKFHSVQADGIMVISRIPWNDSLPCETEDILCVKAGENSIEEGNSTEEWSIDRGNGDIRTYQLVSDVYEVTEESPDSNYAAAIHVSADFINQYEGPLYLLRCNKETGKVEMMKEILSQKELDALPEEESRRDYKTYANGTYGMSAGYQYAVAEESMDGE